MQTIGKPIRRIKLSPLKGKLREKENSFVLDCVNSTKSQLPCYNPLRDPYLQYCVIRTTVVKPPKKKNRKNNSIQLKTLADNSLASIDPNVSVSKFSHYLEEEKPKPLAQADSVPSLSKQQFADFIASQKSKIEQNKNLTTQTNEVIYCAETDRTEEKDVEHDTHPSSAPADCQAPARTASQYASAQ